MDGLGLRPANVVGYSMGGMIAQSICRRHPGTIGRLVLAGTAAFPIPERRMLTWVAFVLARAAGRIGSPVGARISYHYLLRVGAVERRHAAWLWDEITNRDINLYFEGGRAILNFDARPWVGKIDVPALVIIPTEDQLVGLVPVHVAPGRARRLGDRHRVVVRVAGRLDRDRGEGRRDHAPVSPVRDP